MYTKQKKITLATIKSFINKNKENLYIANKSSFDGMVDMVVDCNNRGFSKTSADDHMPNNTLGIVGIWIVGQSRDYFQNYEDSTYKGYTVSNCCGSFILAVTK